MRRRHLGHEPLCPQGTCISCTLRRRAITKARARGWRGRGKVRTWIPWTPQEERILRECIGVLDIPEIRAKLLQETGILRTENAILVRYQRLGIPRQKPGRSVSEVGYLMGVSHDLVRRWIQDGFLGPKPPFNHVAMIADGLLESFIREHPERYDRSRIRRSYLRRIADVTALRDPWLGCREIAVLMGINQATVRKMFRRGEIPGEKVSRLGPHPGGPRWIARRSEVLRIITDQPRSVPPGCPQDARRTAS